MSESILDQWEEESHLCECGQFDCPTMRDDVRGNRIRSLIARDRILYEALKFYTTGLVMTGTIARLGIEEADKILETTNKGENK